MTRKQPLEHSRTPSAFGRVSTGMEWRQPSTLDGLVALRHAETQHHFAYEFRRWQLISNTPSEAFKGEWKLNGERIERCLRGQKWLSLGDMLRLEQIAGPILARLRFEPAPLTHPVLIEQFPRAPGVAEAESVH